MKPPFPATDVKRRGGWLPDGQGALEAWLTGHRERVEADMERLVVKGQEGVSSIVVTRRGCCSV
jgi:hypothetical protein